MTSGPDRGSERPPLSDTSPEAEKVLIELYRRMPAWQKLGQVADLNRTVEELAMADIRRCFQYIFDGVKKESNIPQLDPRLIDGSPFDLFGLEFLPVPIMHGRQMIHGTSTSRLVTSSAPGSTSSRRCQDGGTSWLNDRRRSEGRGAKAMVSRCGRSRGKSAGAAPIRLRPLRPPTPRLAMSAELTRRSVWRSVVHRDPALRGPPGLPGPPTLAPLLT